MAKKIMINVQEEQKEQWVKAAHQEMVSLSEWIRRACDARLGNTLQVLAAQPLTDQQIKDAAEGAIVLTKTVAAKELPVEDAGTAPVSVPTATPRLTPEQSSLQAALAETAARRLPAGKDFTPDFKAEPKPKKPRR